MAINDELKEIDIKNSTCCYFDDKTKIEDSDINNVLIDFSIYTKIFKFIIFHTKFSLILSLYVW